MADSRTLACTMLLLAGLLAVAPRAAAQEVCDTACKAKITSTVIETCRNYKVIECWCTGDCGKSKKLGPFRVDPETKPDEYCKAMLSKCGSLIDNMTFNHIHWAHDWQLASAEGCAPCGGSAGESGSGLPELSLKRTHRFRDIAEVSSLGPGVFFDHDISVSFDWQREGAAARIFNPNQMNPRWVYDGQYGDVADGEFRDGLKDWEKSKQVRWVRLTAAADGQGAVVDCVGDAGGVLLRGFDGVHYRFDVINLDPSSTGRAAIDGRAVAAMDGFATYVAVPSSSLLNSGVHGQRTVSVSFRADDPSSPTPQVLYEEGDQERGLTIYLKGGQLHVAGHNQPDAESDWNGTHLSGGTVTAGTWHTAVLVLDGGASVSQGAFTAYLDGVAIGSGDGSQLWAHPGDITIAAAGPQTRFDAVTTSGSGRSAFFDGAIDQVQIFNRAATASEIAGGSLGTASLVADWGFDEAAGCHAADASGSGLHAGVYGWGQLAARLSSYEDRNGYRITLSRPAWTPAEIAAAPDRQWQVSRVSDAHGRTLDLQYAAAQVAGRWVVEAVTLPNAQQVTYGYLGDQLETVDHPDGSTSTFTWGFDTETGLTTLHYDDAAAEDVHRRKTIYLTNTFNDVGDPNDYYTSVYNSASLLVRLIENGAGEVSYFNYFIAGDPSQWVVYEGGHKLKLITPLAVRYYQDGWTLDHTKDGFDFIVGTLEPTYVQQIWSGDNPWQHYAKQTWPERKTADGLTIGYSYDADDFVTEQRYSDGTSASWSYNEFKQITRAKDRLDRVTRFVYDARGNLLERQVGILEVNGQDVEQPEYAVYRQEYFPSGHQHQHLLAASFDANGQRTDYVYDDRHFLAAVIEPADSSGSQRAETHSTYTTSGQVATQTDPRGRLTILAYDARDRLERITHQDGSTEQIEYGSGQDANLVTRRIDRVGSVTDYEYDAHGRRTRTLTGHLVEVGGSIQTVADPSVAVDERCSYLVGTNDLEDTCIRAGETTTYTWDYRHRQIARSQQPQVGQSLSWEQTYRNNLLFKQTDPYGRSSYRNYRASDNALVRTVQTTVPGIDYADFGTVAALQRDAGPNAAILIQDRELDAERQLLATIDARGIATTHAYDSRGRRTLSIEAAGSAIAARSEFDYDAQSNLTEIRHPRQFTETGEFRTVMTYTGRNLLASRTEAADTPDAATERFTYHLDRRIQDRTDALGRIWTTTWGSCCGRIQGQLDPTLTLPGQTGSQRPARITRHDDHGNLSHQGVVTDYDGAIFPSLSDPTNATNLPDGQTVNETTTRYDARHRPLAQTVWLVPLGLVDANDPPIANRASVAVNAATHPASAGLTTTWTYDDDLTDGVGLDASLASDLAVLGPNFFGSGADGSAVAITNPAGETTIQIADGLGRTVLRIDGVGDRVRTSYDSLIAGTPGAPTAGSGKLLVTSQIRDPGGLALSTSRRSDGAGRVLAMVDAEGHLTRLAYDANGNRISLRDPKGVGENCSYDERNRETICIDTEDDTRFTIYDAHANVVQTIDGEGVVALGGPSAYPSHSQLPFSDGSGSEATLGATTCRFDQRDRKVACDDRIDASTTYAYDDNSNLLRITDAEGGETVYAYDERNLLVAERFPGHDLASNYDQRLYAYDAARRLVSRDDQRRDVTIYHYDLANRLEARDYPDHLVAPGVDDRDHFTYDAASRLLSATSTRFDVVVARSYHADSTLADETLQIDGLSYVIAHAYDAAKRPVDTIYPDASLLVSTWTDRDQLETRTYAGSLLLSISDYDAAMRETVRSLGNGLSTTRTFGRSDNLVTGIQTLGVVDFGYSYDANKRKLSETDGSPLDWDQTFGYDPEDRLTSWDRGVTTAASIPSDRDWTLSPVGDWQDVTIDGVIENRDHNAVHELTQRQIGGGTPIDLSYDAKGNLTSDGSQAYTWDVENRLISATGLPDSGSASYRYDALGRRVQKTVTTVTAGTVVTTYVCAGAQVLSEYEAVDGGPTVLARSFVYGSYVDEPVAMVTGMGTFYYHQNHLYSVAALTDTTGAVVERYGYDAYGDSVVTDASGTPLSGNESSVGNPYRFTGRRLDEETGLMYYRARFYSGELGRFIERDPYIYVDGMNTYSAWFVPNLLDPSGQSVVLNAVSTHRHGTIEAYKDEPGDADTLYSIPGEVFGAPNLSKYGNVDQQESSSSTVFMSSLRAWTRMPPAGGWQKFKAGEGWIIQMSATFSWNFTVTNICCKSETITVSYNVDSSKNGDAKVDVPATLQVPVGSTVKLGNAVMGNGWFQRKAGKISGHSSVSVTISCKGK